MNIPGITDRVDGVCARHFLVCVSLVWVTLACNCQVAYGQVLSSPGLPSIAKIEQEIIDLQGYFKNRFPDAPIEEFNNGAYSLPQSENRRFSWKLLKVLPPYEHAMIEARNLWIRPSINGSRMDDCFDGHPGANQFPYFGNGRIITIESAINECLRKNGKNTLEYSSSTLAALTAVAREKSNGKPFTINIDSTEIRQAYAQGRQLFWARRGQNNFSCASCHIENAGNRLRGDVISASLGHPAPFPLFSPAMESSGAQDPWITLHDQYAACFVRAGAEPPRAQSSSFIALEVYQAITSAGVPVNAPGLRP